MPNQPNVPQSVANYIRDAEERVNSLIRRQFRWSAALVLCAIFLFFGLYLVMAVYWREPVDSSAFDRLTAATEHLSDLTLSLLPTSTTKPAPDNQTAIAAVVAQAEMHREALAEVRKGTEAVSPEGISLLQLLGGSAVLALLGLLGLQRLQNVDAQIEGVQKNMFEQVKQRVQDVREILLSAVNDNVDKRMEATKEEISKSSEEAIKTATAAMADLEAKASAAEERVKETGSLVDAVFQRYPWLESPVHRDMADDLSGLVSVEQAHSAAVRFTLSEQAQSARLALKVIVDKGLQGSPEQFHNAYVQAMRLDDPELGVAILEKGLERHPDHHELLADKGAVLPSLGRAPEARDMLAQWLKRSPHEFSRGWRPFVFYMDAIEAGELAPDENDLLESTFNQVSERLPHATKVWSKYARFLHALGRSKQAFEILKRGIERNPYSQELNYVIGDMFLQQGHVEDAMKYLQQALAIDYQEQFQPDVNQYEVMGLLAHAHEAMDQLESAERIYKVIATTEDSEAYHAMKGYAVGRLRSIALRRGDSPGGSS